jgi:hypothetical protein
MRTTVRARALVLTCAFAIAAVLASTAAAAALTAGTWQSFTFGVTGSTASGSPFTFTSPTTAVVTVTDAFCGGDRFTVSDGATELGTTSAVPVEGCPGTNISDPDLALANSAYSHGHFVVGAGTHSIGVIVSTSPYNGGGAYIRYDLLTADMCKKGGWETFQPLFKNQGDCVSFVVTGGRDEPAGS